MGLQFINYFYYYMKKLGPSLLGYDTCQLPDCDVTRDTSQASFIFN